MDITQENRDAKIITPLGEDVLVLKSMEMTEELGRLFSIDVELLSLQENIAFDELLGQKATIHLRLTEQDDERFFNGYITHFSQTRNEGPYAVYHATLRPWFWFLTRTADCKIFQKINVPDIIKQVFGDFVSADFEDKLTKSYQPWEYCVQYRESDFNFISRLMEHEGIYYYFKHEKDKHILVLADGYTSHEPVKNKAIIDYYPPDDSAVKEEEHCSHWIISKQVQAGKYALNDFDFKRPKANLNVNKAIPRNHSLSDDEIYDYPGKYIKVDEGNHYAQNRIEEMHTGRHEELHSAFAQTRTTQDIRSFADIQGKSDVRVIKSGDLFTLSEYPREDQNREYLLIAIKHHIQLDHYSSAQTNHLNNVYTNEFSVIPSDQTFRPARTTPKALVKGTQTAIVVGPAGEEIYTDEYSRVKVQFHWDRYGKYDENSSCWIRVSQLWAGKNWGGIHIPRIGQEVIVDFLEGDPDRPIITGRVYNADQMPPYKLPANKTQSGIKSRSSKKGTPANFNEIRMEDQKGQEELYIHAEKNHTNITENDRNEDVGHDRSLHVGHDKSEKIDNNKTIIVDGTHTETIKKDTTIKITEGNHIHRVEKGTETHYVKKLVTEKFDDSQNTTVKKDINITASTGKICITAETEIELHVGNSLLIMKKDGTIKLSGKDISITGTQKVEVGVGTQSTTYNNKSITHSAAEITSAAVGIHNVTGAIVKIN